MFTLVLYNCILNHCLKGGPSFSRRPAVNNSIYGREQRGIGPFLPRCPPAQTPIGSLMPQAHSPYNLSPHGSQGLGSVSGVRLGIFTCIANLYFSEIFEREIRNNYQFNYTLLYFIFQAEYSPRAKRRDGGQQARPISADVGRLFAVEEHSNERTGTSAMSGASSSGSHAQGGFKKGRRDILLFGFLYFSNFRMIMVIICTISDFIEILLVYRI